MSSPPQPIEPHPPGSGGPAPQLPVKRPYDLCNCLAIRKAARHVTQFYDHRLAPSGLTTAQFSTLARLRHRGPSTINDLAADMVMDRTTMGRNLRPLEREGLVAIATDPGDRRRRALTLTTPGLQRLTAARPLWDAAQQEFAAAFGAEAADALRATLAALVATDLPTPSASLPSESPPLE